MTSDRTTAPGPAASIRCPSCQTPMAGPFCHQCGARPNADATTCPSCGARSAAGRFCAECGAGLSGARRTGPGKGSLSRIAPWVLGGALALALIALLVRQPPAGGPGTPVPASQPGAAGGGAPPDLSSMTPRERFIRLYDRVINAAQSGDQATVEQFMPMALAAYGMLDKIDPDARYHLAMIQLHVGDVAAAQAQADTLVRLEPGHLFGYVIDAAVARWKQDSTRRDEAYREFTSRYQKEIASGKPEYAEHKSMLEQVLQAARPR